MLGEPGPRRLAGYVLLVWLLALTVGIVNACELEPSSHRGALERAHGDHAHAASCIEAFDVPAVSAPTAKQLPDSQDGAWLASTGPGVSSLGTVLDSARTSIPGHDPGRPAIPIAIAFLRLTL
jgi:hypothetical protein